MAIVDLRHADITIEDGEIVPNSVYLKVGEGTLSYTEARPLKYTTDRGRLDEVMLEKPAPLDVKMDATWTKIGAPTTKHFSDGTKSTSTPVADLLQDILKGKTPFVSADPDLERPHAVNIVIKYKTNGGADETTITLPLFRYESLAFDLNAGTIAVAGKCFTTDAILTEA